MDRRPLSLQKKITWGAVDTESVCFGPPLDFGNGTSHANTHPVHLAPRLNFLSSRQPLVS